MNRKNSPERKMKSATFSYRILGSLLLRMDKNESTQLIMNRMMANAVSSSTKVVSILLFMLIDVRTIKQSPRSVADVLRMCGDFSLFSFIG